MFFWTNKEYFILAKFWGQDCRIIFRWFWYQNIINHDYIYIIIYLSYITKKPILKSLSLSLKIWYLAGLSLSLKHWDQNTKVSVSVSKFETSILSLSLSLKIWYQGVKVSVSVSKIDTNIKSLSLSLKNWDWYH